MGDQEGTQGSSAGEAPPPPYSPPPTGAPQGTAPPAPPGAPMGQPPAPQKKSRAGLIIAIVVVLLLCCCGGAAGLGWWLYDQGTIEGWGDVEVNTDPGAVSVDESDPGDAVRVVLEWDDPVDLDLELWESDGETFVTSAYTEGSPDITDGDGAEYFDLDGEYGEGEWVMSVYFASTDGVEETEARVTVQRPGQQDEVVMGTVYYDPDEGDQWHAVRVDADTGEVEVLDYFY